MTQPVVQERKVKALELTFAKNIRTDFDTEKHAELKASILSKGVIQNLSAAASKNGAMAVFAGGRRLRAVHELIGEGKLAGDFEILINDYAGLDPEGPEAIEIATMENIIRADMSYADECAAMAKLSSSGKSDADIAAAFGFKPKTVKERLLISQIVPEAMALLREGTRSLDWARAMTTADKSLQTKICQDIADNPASWKTGEDIRNFYQKSMIPVENAIFAADDYTGTIVSDFFDGDKFADPDVFWQHQNTAIEEKRAELEAKGYREVIVSHEPFADWKWEACTDRALASAVIEIQPSGKVTVHEDLVAAEGNNINLSDEAALNTSFDDTTRDIHPLEVRPTPRTLEYAAAQRSVLLQTRLAGDFRASLEYAVLAFLGAQGASFSVRPFKTPGRPEWVPGNLAMAQERINAKSTILPAGEISASAFAQIVSKMKDNELQDLFAHLVARSAGQVNKHSADAGDTVTNLFGADIAIRDFWTPDEEFFKLMATDDLRRLAQALAPQSAPGAFMTVKRKQLTHTLARFFRDARDGVLAAEDCARINAWVPGIMSFPAKLRDPMEDVEDAEDVDLEALLFDAPAEVEEEADLDA